MKKYKNSKKIGLPRVLIIGCGDVGMRILPLLRAQLQSDAQRAVRAQFKIFATTSQPSRCNELRAAGAIPLVVNLDDATSLARLAGLASHIIYLAPPPSEGEKDSRSRHLAAVLSRRCRLVYISTSGVYGDCEGAFIDETRAPQPRNGRAIRRIDAEQVWRQWARRTGSCMSILRVPGIYAADRLPIDRLKKGTPALLPIEDVYSNHIHADDLARITVKALFHASSARIYHASDDSSLLMGDYFDLVAEKFHLPKAPRLPRCELIKQINPMLLSFMSESRRMRNDRIKAELGVRLLYPSVREGLAAIE